MKSPTILKGKTCKPTCQPRRLTSGFTLIEVLIILTLIAMVSGLGFYFSLDNFRGYSFRTDRDTLVSALQHARAEAMANICRGGSLACTDGTSEPHGIFIDTASHKFIIFQGTSYALADHSLDAALDYSPSNTMSGDDQVVFAQLSGNVSVLKNITIKDASTHTSTISINTEGQIIWTN